MSELKKAPKLPKEVYVRWENDGEDWYLLCDDTAEAAVSPGEKKTVGVYELQKVGHVKAEVVVGTDLA